jgi:GNAT superfamily N-acetyltransferase
MQSQPNILIYRYKEHPVQYRQDVLKFAEQSLKEGNDSIDPQKYHPDDPNIETWLSYLDGKLISISAAERSTYTNDPDIAVRVCRYHILKDYRFTHCGLRMGEHQIKWAREEGYQILYVTHNIKNRAINALYQRKKKMTVPSFKEWTQGEWYNSLQLEKDFLFKTGDMLQYIYSIRLQDPEFIWKPTSNFIVKTDESIN